jgi:hypothetical protein
MENTTRAKNGGRTKGTPNKDNLGKKLFKVLCEYLIEENMQKFREELDTLKGKEFVNAFIQLYKIKPTELDRLDANDQMLLIFKEKLKTK